MLSKHPIEAWCCWVVLLGSLDRAAAVHEVSLQAEIQTLIENISQTTRFGIGVGFVDTKGLDFGIGTGPRTPAGLPQKAKPGNLTANDTYVTGSGTKPFTSTCVMRLVDQGKVSLDDKAFTHIDRPMQKMWNTTLVQLFGPMAANVTVAHLIRMQSGIGDSDVPKYGDLELKSTTVHSPFLDLQYVANYTGPFGCKYGGCTWVCAPGTCTSYSSTNFLLASLVLLAHAPPNQTTWESYEFYIGLGPDFSTDVYQHTYFPSQGPLPSKGLTTAGYTVRSYGGVEVYSQDASIMGWGYGNEVTSPRDMARFFFDLLGPSGKFVSKASLAAMQKFSLLDTGWSMGSMMYGAGLEIRDVAPVHENPPKITDVSTFVGHDGVTFGFFSNQGWFQQLNSSIVVMTNQDHDDRVNYAITCHIVKIVAKYKGVSDGGLKCMPPTAASSTNSWDLVIV